MTSEHAADVGHSAADIDKHVKVYIIVFVTLMVLTIVTVAIARVHLPCRLPSAWRMLVATIKGSLVAGYFMHLSLREEADPGRPRLTVAFFVALLRFPS
jgi:cytochrome c oxidase subunit 4